MIARPRHLVALTLLPLAIGCGSDEPVAGEPLDPVTDAGTDAENAGDAHDADAHDADADAGPVTDGAPPIRTVETRNPFGNTTVASNLLVDGDFELTSGSGQHGWRAMDTARGEVPLERETGGLCRSGVVCGVLEQGASMIGFAAAPADAPVDVSVWIRPPGDSCEVVNASLISCMSLFPLMLARIDPVSSTPDESGWCELRGTSSPLDEQPCIFLQGGLALEGRALVDQAVLVGADPDAPMTLSATVPTSRELDAIHGALDWLDRNRRLERPMPRDFHLE